MAGYLNLSSVEDPALFSLVIQSLLELPEGWSIGITTPANDHIKSNNNEGTGGDGNMENTSVIPYFFREDDGRSSWQHPEVQKWRDRVVVMMTQKESMGKSQ